MKHTLLLLFTLLLGISACSKNIPEIQPSPPEDNGTNYITITSQTITPSFIGIGPQWGGYDNVQSWTGNSTLSDADWNTLYTRLNYMKPPLMRIMVSPGWNYPSGNFNKSAGTLFKMLDYCQSAGIDVIYGEWGHQGGTSIDTTWLNLSVAFYQYLIQTKGYTCIKYFNMVNEPNGDWSSIKGNYNLWKELIKEFNTRLVAKNLVNTCSIIGPDIAIWDANSTSWVTNTKNDIGSMVTTYDIHTYPTETVVRGGNYSSMIKAYKSAAPASAPMLMTELGFKYDASSTLGIENAQRISADPNASTDSNMMIYKAFYGIDMADAVMQNMLMGYAGVILWDLDDAMYNNESLYKIKRWGFWNILGAEVFKNANDENIRPWFYTMSLLSKYFPKGTQIMAMKLPNLQGIRAVAGIKGGKWTIAIVNSSAASYTRINLKMENGVALQNLQQFTYIAGNDAAFTGKLDASGFAAPANSNTTLDLSSPVKIDIPAQSFNLYTNM